MCLLWKNTEKKKKKVEKANKIKLFCDFETTFILSTNSINVPLNDIIYSESNKSFSYYEM